MSTTVNTQSLNISAFSIKIGGAEIDTSLKEKILELVVDSSRQLPDMFTLRIFDNDFGADPTLVDGKTFDLGKPVEISAGEEAKKTLFKGEVTAIEPEFTPAGEVIFLVRGYDKSHRLHRGRRTRVFSQQSDDQIISKIAQEAGLSAQTDSTSPTHEHVWQKNQTDMEFVRERARRLGFETYVEDATLYFKKPAPASGSPVDLEWGLNLRNFRPKMAVNHLVDKTVVRSWDPSAKAKVEGASTAVSSTDHQGGVSDDGGAQAKKAFGQAESHIVNYPLIDQTQAENMAKALYDRLARRYVQAEGLCFGNPGILAGNTVNVIGVGERFSGTYIVTEATHIFTTERGYETEFTIRGHQPDIMTYILEGEQADESKRALIPGVVPAIVTNTKDPDKLGRVKVKYDWLDDQLESHWMRVAAPTAGAERGFLALPEVDDEVLVAFEHGDFNAPYIVGALWNGQDALPPGTGDIVAGDGKITQRLLRSRAGHIIILDDTDGAEQIIIRDKTEANEIIIDSVNNDIIINLDNDFTLTAKNKISTNSDANTDIASGGDMTLQTSQGSKITIQSASDVTVKAQANMKLEATGNMELKATGQLKIQGTQVSVSGDAMTEIKGGLVKIN